MREVEARLKLSAVDRTAKAFSAVQGRLKAMERQVSGFNRVNQAVERSSGAAVMALGRIAAPVALAYGAAQTVTAFARVERAVERIGITAGASTKETAAAFRVVDKAAYDYAMSQDDVRSGLDALTASGRDMQSALAFLPSVAATAQAAGADIGEIATTADAIGNAFGIAGPQMQNAFDILVTAGKLGKFELKDMASYLPTLAPAFEALGYKGEYAVKKLAASLQVVREGTGSAEEAATAFSNVLQKMETEETVKRFGKFGIDLRKEMKKARDEGKDLVDVFVNLSDKAIKGDLSKLPQLFGDAQMITGMRALINGTDSLAKNMAALGNSTGAVKTDLDRILAGSQAKIDRMSASWTTFITQVGGGLSSVASPALDTLNQAMNDNAAFGDGVKKEEDRGGSKAEAFAEYKRRWQKNNPGSSWGGFNKQLQEDFDRDMSAYGRGEIAGPYARVDAVANRDNPGRFAGKADAQAASDARRARDAQNLDGLSVRRGGVPIPSNRDLTAAAPMSEQEQRAQYGRGRLLGEAAARQGQETMSGREALGGIVGRMGPDPDELRQAMETGGQSVAAAGETAGSSIQASGESAAATWAATFQQGAALIGSAIASALSTAVKVNVTSAAAALPRANAAPASTMVDAGMAGAD